MGGRPPSTEDSDILGVLAQCDFRHCRRCRLCRMFLSAQYHQRQPPPPRRETVALQYYRTFATIKIESSWLNTSVTPTSGNGSLRYTTTKTPSTSPSTTVGATTKPLSKSKYAKASSPLHPLPMQNRQIQPPALRILNQEQLFAGPKKFALCRATVFTLSILQSWFFCVILYLIDPNKFPQWLITKLTGACIKPI